MAEKQRSRGQEANGPTEIEGKVIEQAQQSAAAQPPGSGAQQQPYQPYQSTGPSCIHGCITAKQSSKCGTQVVQTPLPNVPVELYKEGLFLARTPSGPDGCFEFSNLGCGNYDVVPAPLFQDLAPPDPKIKVGFLAPGAKILLHPIIFGPPQGIISGRLVLQGGAGVAFEKVTLKDLNSPHLIPNDKETYTDTNGAFSFAVPAGDYEVDPQQTVPAGAGGITFPLADPNQKAIPVKSPSTVPDIVYKSGPLIGAITGQIQQIGQSAATIASIIPTAMQASPGSQGASPALGAGLVPYDQVVEASFTRVLGARVNGDATKIVNLLNSSFASSEQRGQTYYTWRPRGVTTVSSTMGQLVGGQVTLYQQAQDIQTQVTRLLDAIEPIVLDADDEDIAAFKQDVATSLAGIVSETGRPGGAVTPRVTVLLQTLQGDLTTLKTKLGLIGVNDPALLIDMDVTQKEQNQQNFDVLENLLRSGGTLDSLLNPPIPPVFSGTLLARLNWLTEVIPGTVQQVYATMDSVGFGPADRRVTPIDGPNGKPDQTTIEQLLLWIESAASVDWPNRLVAGSARGSEVQAVKREAESQAKGVDTLFKSLVSIIPIGVDRAGPVVQELQRELVQVSALAQSITH
jgi:hypothetical protein